MFNTTKIMCELIKRIKNIELRINRMGRLESRMDNLEQQMKRIDGLEQRTDNLEQQMKRIDGLERRTDNLERQIKRIGAVELRTDALENAFASHTADLRDHAGRIQTGINRPTSETVAVESGSAFSNIRNNENSGDVPSSSSKEKHDNNYREIDYFDFENHFRGSKEMIKERQKVYLSYFQGCRKVLDLGCGRGEFLELLQENGIPAIGVDTYDEYVELCLEHNLNAIKNDAVGYLETKPDTSVDGIFMGQVVEHVTTSYLIYFCELAYKKLKPGSKLIMETPNPMCLSIFSNAFYLDPSHQKPVHPYTLQYILQKAGFENTEIIFTEASKCDVQIPELKLASADDTTDNLGDFNDAMAKVQNLLFGSQDYAIIATR